jgi:hypothetical protein
MLHSKMSMTTLSPLALDKVSGGACGVRDALETGYLKGLCSKEDILHHIQPEYRPKGLFEGVGFVAGRWRAT